ncbi:hypothetical protein F511_12923 [Dorcoceras hygrometricum]|uniref:Uncharacterized protein n=1 Tax=Dorcoceras hygrometricum TaxID=472368 RepID=A0A2Z7C092_9LAMI|nr:hypothetical protein F511_12923 [Dorcoceras hygrometricum]
MVMTAITFDVKVNWSSLLFGILKEMVTPDSRQAKGYAIQICVLLKNIHRLELGESRAFPVPRVLTEKMVHRYVVINEKKRKRRLVLEAEDEIVDDQPAAEAATGMQEPVIDNDQATVVNEGPSTTDDVDDIIQQVLTETAQLETTDEGDPVDEPDVSGTHVEDQPAGPAVERPWFYLPYEDIIAQLNDRTVVTPSDTDEVELIIDAVTETGAATDCVVGEPVDEEMGNDEGSVNVRIDADEAMSLEDIILSIPVDVPLPSAGVEITKIVLGQTVHIIGVDEGDWYKASLPKIHSEEMGKDPLQLKDPAKGKPPQENYSLICADIDLLVHLRERVIDEVAKLFYCFSLKKLAQLQIDDSYFEKEALVLYWAKAESIGVALQWKLYILLKYREILVRKFLDSWQQNFVPGEGTYTVDLKVIHLLSDLHSFILEELKQQTVGHGLRWNKTCCSQLFEGRSRTTSAAPTSTNFEVSRQRSYDDTLPPMSAFFKLMKKRWGDVCLRDNNFAQCTDYSDFQRMDDAQSDILSRLHTIERGLRDTLRQQDEYFRHLIQSARQDGQNHSDLHLLHLNEFKKSVLAQNVTVIADFMDVKKAVRELKAKVDVVSTRLDDVKQDIEATKEAISHQLLDFQEQAQANHNIITDQLSELVNYINRNGNNKKGEGSSRGPQPPPDDQNIGSGNTGGGGDTNRSIVERLLTADRQRQKERSRGHSSGSYKRRRY